MPYPTYKDSGGLVRSVQTVSSGAAGSNADPDQNLGFVEGMAATDAPAVGNPVLQGEVASNATPAAVSADGDVVPPWSDRYGRRMVADPADVIQVTLVLDTSAYASGDLLVDAQAVAAAVRVNGGAAELVSLMVYDEDDQGAAFDVYLTNLATTWGSINSAPSITDAVARGIQCIVPVATGDYKDLGGVRVANIKNIGALVEAAAGSTSLYVAVVNGSGSPTYTASGVRLAFGFRQH